MSASWLTTLKVNFTCKNKHHIPEGLSFSALPLLKTLFIPVYYAFGVEETEQGSSAYRLTDKFTPTHPTLENLTLDLRHREEAVDWEEVLVEYYLRLILKLPSIFTIYLIWLRYTAEQFARHNGRTWEMLSIVEIV